MAKKDINKEKKNNNFFKELKAELKKVTWPTFKKLVNNTGAVISIVLILSVIVFILDVCFENLNKFGIEKLKSAVSSSTENEDSTDESEENDNVSEENDFDGIDLVSQEETNSDSDTEVTDDSNEDVQE